MISAIFNAIIFGNMTLIVSELSKKAQLFQEKLDTANTAMKNMELPADTQNKVINYLLYTEAGLEHRKELEDF